MTVETVTATLTFHGVQQPLAYYSLGGLNGGSSTIHVAMPFDASSLATGRYAYSLSIDSPNMSAPATIDGALNVVNDAAGPAGAGWDVTGVQRLYVNSAGGVAAGVLETDGTGNAFYFLLHARFGQRLHQPGRRLLDAHQRQRRRLDARR